MINYRVGQEEDCQNISKLLIDTWKGCYKEFIPAEFLSSLNLDKQVQRHEKYMRANTKYYVAENEHNELIGFASYGKTRFEKVSCETELYTLYVKKNHHGRGVGKSLLNSIWFDLSNTQSRIAVSVFKKNPFKRFYLKNGFIKVDEETIDMGEFELAGEIYIKE